MEYVYVAAALGVVALVVLSLIAVRLFKVVKAFGREVTRVSQEISAATAGLEQAAGSPPPKNLQLKPRHNPEQ